MNYTLTDYSIKPDEITRYEVKREDQSTDVVDIAVFEYYKGIESMEANNIPQIVTIEEFTINSGYLVSCGKVMIRIRPDDFPDISRKYAHCG